MGLQSNGNNRQTNLIQHIIILDCGWVLPSEDSKNFLHPSAELR